MSEPSTRGRSTFLIVLPTTWWAIQHSFASQLPDWNSDVRFFDAYWIPAAFFEWLYSRTGSWYGQPYWVAIQDAAIGFVLAAAGSVLLLRQAWWRNHQAVRACLALAGVLLPWYPLYRYLSVPDYYETVVFSLATSYLIAASSAFLLPIGRGVGIALLVLASLIGMLFIAWRFELANWTYWASLLAPLGLLIQSTGRLVKHESVV